MVPSDLRRPLDRSQPTKHRHVQEESDEEGQAEDTR